jgi:hypothetical protein
LRFWLVWPSHEHADAPRTVNLLRVRREWPRRCRTTNKRDEIAPPHEPLKPEGDSLPHSSSAIVHHGKLGLSMSALGQKRTSEDV